MNIKEIKKEIEIKEKELNELKTQIENIRTYDTIIILNTNTTLKEYENIKKEITRILDNENIKNIEELGAKKLAYEIQKNNEGFYVEIEFDGIIQTIEELERYYRSNDNILKFITIKKVMED